MLNIPNQVVNGLVKIQSKETPIIATIVVNQYASLREIICKGKGRFWVRFINLSKSRSMISLAAPEAPEIRNPPNASPKKPDQPKVAWLNFRRIVRRV